MKPIRANRRTALIARPELSNGCGNQLSGVAFGSLDLTPILAVSASKTLKQGKTRAAAGRFGDELVQFARLKNVIRKARQAALSRCLNSQCRDFIVVITITFRFVAMFAACSGLDSHDEVKWTQHPVHKC